MFDLHYDHLPVLIFSAPHGKRGICDRRNRQLGSILQPQLCFHVFTQIKIITHEIDFDVVCSKIIIQVVNEVVGVKLGMMG